PVRAVHLLECVSDFVERGVGPNAIEHRLDYVLIALGSLSQSGESGVDRGLIAPAAELRQALALPRLRALVDLQDLDVRGLVAPGEGVDANDDALARLDLALLALGAARDLALEVARLDPRHHATQPVDLVEDRLGLPLQLVGQRLDV